MNRKKLLIIDNNDASREMLKVALSEEFSVLEAKDAIEGLSLLEHERDIQVVLFELLLPKMSGLEFLQLVRRNEKYKGLVMLVVTLIGESSDEATAFGIGADDYICMPFTPEVVSARIKNVLHNREILTNSESRFGLQRNILDATLTAIYVVDAVNFNLFYANSAAISLLQCPNNIYSGKKCYEFFFRGKYPCKHCKLVIAHTNDNVTELLLPCINKTVQARISMMEWLGRPAYVIYMTDITEEKHARELAKERYEHELQRRYRVDLDFMAYLVINVTKGTVLEHDPHGFPVPTISPGQPASEFVERVLPTVIDFEKRREFVDMMSLENLRKAYDEGKTLLVIDYRRYSRNEKYIMWARSTIQLMLDPASNDLMGFLYTYDINESKMMQDIINASVYRDYNMIAYLNVYTETAKLYAQHGVCLNRPLKQEFAYEQAVGEYIDKYIPQDYRNDVRAKMSLATVKARLTDSEIYEFDLDIIDFDGNNKHRKIRYANFDKIYGMVLWTDMDVTHIIAPEKQAQEELLEEIDGLSYLNEVKTNYLSSISSDLRAPLKKMILRIKGAVNKSDDLAVKQQLHEAQGYAEQINEIINDILDISNIENKKMKLANMQFTLSDLLCHVKSIMKKKYPDLQNNLVVEQQVYHDCCVSDYKAIGKVLTNVLDNAFKYAGQEGTITLMLYELPSPNNEKGYYRFVIKDEGAGISAERLDTIFLPFHSFISNKNKSDSSGLGLPITKGIVEKLGGQIAIVSEIGVGTTVTVDLKLELVNEHHNEKTVKNATEKSIVGLRVLFIEETPLDVLVARRLMEKKGLYVYLADTVDKAKLMIAASNEEKFDCIILNLQMSNVEPLRVISDLRNSANIDISTPIIGIGNNISLEEKHKFFENGINEIIMKPLKFAKLIKSISELCQAQ